MELVYYAEQESYFSELPLGHAQTIIAQWHKTDPSLTPPYCAAWWGANNPVLFALQECCQSADITLVPIPAGASDHHVSTIITKANVRALTFDTDHNDRVVAHELAALLPAVNWDHEKAIAKLPPVEEYKVEPRKGQRILFTAGTDGIPKGVKRDIGADQFRIKQFVAHFKLTKDMQHLIAGPLYHSGPAIFSRVHLQLGCPIRMLPRFDPKRVLSLISDRMVDTIFLVPTQWQMLLDQSEDLSVFANLKKAWIAGAHCSHNLKTRLRGVFSKGVLHEFYGSTETGTVTWINGEEMSHRPDSVGKAAPGVQLTIVDRDGHSLPVGEMGTIFVKSPMVIREYLDGSKGQRLADDSLTVGDRGYLDKEGYLYLVGRKGDMMISGGVNVYPAEVENAAAQIPGISASLCFAVPDSTWGHRIEIAIVPRSGNFLREQDVLFHLKRSLSVAARPKKIHFRTDLPLTAAGKPDRNELRRQLYGIVNEY